MAFVTDSNRPQSLWQPPPTACLSASGTAFDVPSFLMHPFPHSNCLKLQCFRSCGCSCVISVLLGAAALCQGPAHKPTVPSQPCLPSNGNVPGTAAHPTMGTPAPGLLLTAQHHCPPTRPSPPPPPLKRLGQIFFRAFGRSKILSGAFGANSFRPNIFFSAFNAPNTQHHQGRTLELPFHENDWT